MKKHVITQKTGLRINSSAEGETIEMRVDRALNNKEPLDGDGAPLIYTERKDGVTPAHNIRTDRWEYAVEAMAKAANSYDARREERLNPKVFDIDGNEVNEGEDGKPESTQGTK